MLKRLIFIFLSLSNLVAQESLPVCDDVKTILASRKKSSNNKVLPLFNTWSVHAGNFNEVAFESGNKIHNEDQIEMVFIGKNDFKSEIKNLSLRQDGDLIVTSGFNLNKFIRKYSKHWPGTVEIKLLKKGKPYCKKLIAVEGKE